MGDVHVEGWRAGKAAGEGGWVTCMWRVAGEGGWLGPEPFTNTLL